MSFIIQKLNGNKYKRNISIKDLYFDYYCIFLVFFVSLVFHYFMSKEIVTYIRDTNAQIEKHTIFPSKQPYNRIYSIGLVKILIGAHAKNIKL